jgi:2-keto-4-pentenoate hydratase
MDNSPLSMAARYLCAMGLPGDPMFDAANVLDSAVESRRPCAPIRDLLGDDTEYAYAAARVRLERRLTAGATLVGRKVGLTNEAIRAAFGAKEPSWGPIFADTMVSGALDMSGLHEPRLEAEIALILASDITSANPGMAEVRAAIGQVAGAFEVVDSRVANWDVNAIDHIVDFAAHEGFVLGQKFLSPSALDLQTESVDVLMDGIPVASGVGANAYGDPVASLRWLAHASVVAHRPLRTGDVVLTGSIIPPISLTEPGTMTADFLTLGKLTLHITR